MQLERTPVLGVTIAVLVLCLECVGLLAYKNAKNVQQERVVAVELAPPVVEEQIGWHAADVRRVAAEIRTRAVERFDDTLHVHVPEAVGCRFRVDDY